MFERIIITTPLVIAISFLLDLVIGDPTWMPHPVRLIGRVIGFLDRTLYIDKNEKKQFRNGTALAVLTIAFSLICSTTLLVIGFKFGFFFGTVVRIILCTYCIAAHDLKKSAMRVYEKCIDNDIYGARKEVSKIVGRDTETLDFEGVIRATVESVSESTCDGVLAPLFYMTLFGAMGGILYKTINTLDSMVGYRNERYQFFGRVSARLDDMANFVPSRTSAILILISAAILHLDFHNGVMIWKRDRRNHKSPNSAQTESAISGALNIRLGGPASYFGVPENKPFIGDDNRKVNPDDIKLACDLMYFASFLALFLTVILGCIGLYLVYG